MTVILMSQSPQRIGGLALYVLIEKLAPAGPNIGRFTGLVLILWGLWLMSMLAMG